jgi:hypothetical protein
LLCIIGHSIAALGHRAAPVRDVESGEKWHFDSSTSWVLCSDLIRVNCRCNGHLSQPPETLSSMSARSIR